MVLTCSICGKEMEALKSTKKYCSKECELKGRRKREEAKKLAVMQGIDYGIKHCLICNKEFKPKTAAANLRTCCYECMPDGKQLIRSEFLDLLRKQRGGKCERCGYDKYKGALEFHHIDPSQKDFTIGDRDFKLQDCIEESKKCVLICSNCHREVHAGLWDIKDIISTREEEVEPNGANKSTN